MSYVGGVIAIALYGTRFPGQAIEPLPQLLKGIKGHECKMKGTCVQMKGK
jgi:hypothetical protein